MVVLLVLYIPLDSLGHMEKSFFFGSKCLKKPLNPTLQSTTGHWVSLGPTKLDVTMGVY